MYVYSLMPRGVERATFGSEKEVPVGSVIHPPPSDSARRRALGDSQVRVALVTAVCLLVEAVIAKNVIDVNLGFVSQFAPFWVFIAYLVSGLRDRASEISFTVAIVVTTVAVLVLYAL
jgi:hypothetical protein